MRSSGSSPFPQMFSDGAFIIGHGFSFLYGDGVGGTGGQAVPETIAVSSRRSTALPSSMAMAPS